MFNNEKSGALPPFCIALISDFNKDKDFTSNYKKHNGINNLPLKKKDLL